MAVQKIKAQEGLPQHSRSSATEHKVGWATWNPISKIRRYTSKKKPSFSASHTNSSFPFQEKEKKKSALSEFHIGDSPGIFKHCWILWIKKKKAWRISLSFFTSRTVIIFIPVWVFLKPFVNILFLGKKKKKKGGTEKVGGKSCCNPSTGHTICWRLAYMLRLYTAMELWLYWCNIINHSKLHWEGSARLGYVTNSEFRERPVKTSGLL